MRKKPYSTLQGGRQKKGIIFGSKYKQRTRWYIVERIPLCSTIPQEKNKQLWLVGESEVEVEHLVLPEKTRRKTPSLLHQGRNHMPSLSLSFFLSFLPLIQVQLQRNPISAGRAGKHLVRTDYRWSFAWWFVRAREMWEGRVGWHADFHHY